MLASPAVERAHDLRRRRPCWAPPSPPQASKLSGRVTWSAMAFWGAEVKPGKAVPFVPPPEASKLHLSQARARPCVRDALRPCSSAAACMAPARAGKPAGHSQRHCH